MDKLLSNKMKEKIQNAISEKQYSFKTTEGSRFEYSEKSPEYIEVVVFEEGSLFHPMWGEEHFTRDRLERFKRNFDENVRKTEIFLDEDHEPNHRKRGTFEELFFKTSDEGRLQLWAKIHLAPKGKELVKDDEYNYFSPEWLDTWIDPEEEEYKDVLIGGALTNRPFQNHLPKALVYSESFISNQHNMSEDKKLPEDEVVEETKETNSTNDTEEVKEESTQEETKETNLDEKKEGEDSPKEDSTEEVENEESEENSEEPEESKEFSEKMLSELPKTARKYIENLKNENKSYKEKEESRKLSEFVDSFMFSEQNKAGKFLQKSKDKVESFCAGLTESQRKEFSEVLAEVKGFSLGKVGGNLSSKEYSSASEEVSRLEEKYMSEKGLKRREASALIRRENPELIKEYEEEMKPILQ